MSNEEDTSRLVLAIIDFLRHQLSTRDDFSLEDRDSLTIAIECIEMAYGLENNERAPRRPLLDMFTQVANPVSVKDKQEAESLKTEANAQMEQERYQEAEELYSRAIQLDKWNATYHCNRAAARIKLSQFFEAISDCREALTLSPDYAKAYARMGQAYVSMNRARMAASCFRQAVRLEPDNDKYKNNLSVAQNQAEESSTESMTALIHNVLGTIMGGPQGVPGGMGMSPFMIISEPHSPRECPAGAGALTNDSSDSNNESRGTQENEGANQDSSGNDDDNTVHLRVILGIPRIIGPSPDDVDPDRPTDDHQKHLNLSEVLDSNDTLHTLRQEVSDESATIGNHKPNTNEGDEQESNRKKELQLRSNEEKNANKSSISNATDTSGANTNNQWPISVKQPQTNNQGKENETPKNNSDDTESDPFKEIVDSMTASLTDMMKQNNKGKGNSSKSSDSSKGQAEKESKQNDDSQNNSNQIDDSLNRFKTSNNFRNGEKYDASSGNEDDKKPDSVENDASKKKEDDENEHSDGNKDKKSDERIFGGNKINSFLKMFGKSDNKKEGESSKKPANEQDSDPEKIKDPEKDKDPKGL